MNETNGHRDPNAQVMLLLLLVVLVFAVPIRLVVPTPGEEFRRGLVCGMELLFVVPYVLSLPRRQNLVVLSPMGGTLFVAWLIASVMSISLSPHWLPALARQFEWICHILFAAAIWHFLRDNRTHVRWVIIFAITGVMAAVLIVFRAYVSDMNSGGVAAHEFLPLFQHIRPYGHYVLAGLLLSQLWAADPKVGHARLLVPLLAVCVFWGALIWTGGRAAVASALIGLAIIVGLSAERRWILAGVNTIGLSIGSVISAVTSAGNADLGWSGVFVRMAANNLNGFTMGRLQAWKVAYAHFKDQPLFGFGPDAYMYVTPKIFDQHPHNVVLQFLMDYGVVGAGLFGLLMSILVVTMLRRAVEKRVDLRPERVVALSVLLAFSTNALLSGTFYFATPLMVTSLVLAIGLLPESYAVAPRRSGGFLAARTGFAGAAVTVTACFFALYIAVLSNFLVGSVPAPGGSRAQLVRHLPMATHSMVLESWIRAWGNQDPQLATEWAHWAHQHSPDAYRFSSLEAKLLAEQGLYEAARNHAELAIESASGMVRWTTRQSLQPIMDTAQTNSEQLLFEIPGEGR